MLSKEGEIYEGKVTGITNFGAFIKLANGETGMVHISEVAPVYVKDINTFLSEGQDVKVKVLSIGENNKISLSIKQAQPAQERTGEPRKGGFQRAPREQQERPVFKGRQPSAPAGPMTFEDMMAKFKADSEEKMSALKRSTDMGKGSRRGNR